MGSFISWNKDASEALAHLMVVVMSGGGPNVAVTQQWAALPVPSAVR